MEWEEEVELVVDFNEFVEMRESIKKEILIQKKKEEECENENEVDDMEEEIEIDEEYSLNKVSEIEKSKFYLSAINFRFEDIEKLKIKSIINVSRCSYNEEEIKKYKKINVNLHSFPMEDNSNYDISKHMKKVFEVFRDEKKLPCLIHCAAGVSRSPSMLIAFFMHDQKLTFRNSLKKVMTGRELVSPNIGFVNQLLNMEHWLEKNPNKKLF